MLTALTSNFGLVALDWFSKLVKLRLIWFGRFCLFGLVLLGLVWQVWFGRFGLAGLAW